tara:strand:+ start:176 stop:472 length:297 start_codon:yes stop_codon:yes gene_type:complete
MEVEQIIYESVIAFLSQLAFLWARTYNIHATANLEVRKVIISGFVISILWLVGVAIGANGAYKLLVDHNWDYLPIVICLIIGSSTGSYIGLMKKIKGQ